MRSHLSSSILMAVLIGFAAPLSAATPDQVDFSIERAKHFLYSKQKSGTWENVPAPVKGTANAHDAGQWGGLTALATYAMLAAGERPSDPRLVKAIEFLKTADIKGTYALGLRCQVWLLLPQTPEIRTLMHKDAQLLLSYTRTKGEARGLHGYSGDTSKDDYSHSRSQYATLGLWAAAQAGVEVPAGYWKAAEEAWISHQDPSGGWSYKAPGSSQTPVTAGMTTAAVATLFITLDQLHSNQGLDCRGNITNPAIERGVKWITANFTQQVATSKAYGRDFPFATLYAVERVGVAGGLKYFGNIDWYTVGSNWLVKVQKQDGSWNSTGHAAPELLAPIPDTCFGLLFLIRGRAPVAMNKLQYNLQPDNKPGNWNERPRDVAAFATWMGRQTERFLNWQIVSLEHPLGELFDAPILYISGNQGLNFTEEEQRKLQQYVEGGGLILGNADCANKAFADSFRKLGQKLFPAYEFRELLPEHAIYTEQQYPRKAWRKPPSVLGLSNGVRELMLLLPTDDPARNWQMQTVAGKAELHEVAANILLYSVDSQHFRFKGITHVVSPSSKITPARSMKLARLQYSGNWDPEPGGWRRLRAILHNEHSVALSVDAVKLGDGALSSSYPVAHLTGTGRLKLSAAEEADLRKYIEGGGLLVVDAAGGDTDFAASAQALLSSMLGGKPEVLKRDHPLYAMPKLEEVTYRTNARRIVGNLRTPRLSGITQRDRLAVLFSAEDLSAGLVGQAVDGIVGYTPASATDLMCNVIYYGGKLSLPPSTPAPKPKAPAKPSTPAKKK